MKICDLLTFSAVARCASITAAARELNTVQSNVTNRIRSLEEHIGLPLLERHSRGVTLTLAGVRFLPYVQQALTLLDEAAKVARDEGEPKGKLAIGSMETTLALRLPDILANFRDRYRDVNLIMKINATAWLVDNVLNNEVDGAFIAGPLEHPLLVAEKVFEEELVLITPPQYTSIEQLISDKQDITALMFKQGCAYRQRLEQFLVCIGRPAFQRLELGSLDGMIGCVSAGVGITLLPRSIVLRSDLQLKFGMHEIAPSIAHVPTLFVRRKDAHVTTALKCFMESLVPET